MSAHKSQAEALLDEAGLARTGSDVESSRQIQALVHATLEVAEQQRIANLIELSKGAAGSTARMAAYTALLDQEDEGFHLREFVRPEIREALGLS